MASTGWGSDNILVIPKSLAGGGGWEGQLRLQRMAWDGRVEGEGCYVWRILGRREGYVEELYRIRGRASAIAKAGEDRLGAAIESVSRLPLDLLHIQPQS